MSDDKLNVEQKKQGDRPSLASFVEAYQKKNSEPKRTNRALVIDQVAKHMITGRVFPLAETVFPEKFIVASPAPGKNLIYRELNDKKEVELVTPQFVTESISAWCSANWMTYPELLIEPDTAGKIFKNWLARVEKVPEIESFEFADGTNYVTHRIPFVHGHDLDFSSIDIHDPETQQKYPYVEFLSRCSSPKQLNAFIGSIFYDDSYLQQYLILWGAGGDGKGALLRALGKLLDRAFHTDNFEFMNQFWTSSFIGKRLIVFPDNNDQKAMQRGIWKQLTGGDDIRIEIKNGICFTAKLNAKFIVTSNFAPVLKMDKADQRRAIVVHVDAPTTPNAQIDAQLQTNEQLKFLVDYSTWQYRQTCGTNHGAIQIDAKQHLWMENADDALEQKILSRFRFGGGYVTHSDQIRTYLDRDYNANKVARILTDRFGCVAFRCQRTDEDDGTKVRKVYYAGLGIQDQEEINARNIADVKDSPKYKEALTRLKIDQELIT